MVIEPTHTHHNGQTSVIDLVFVSNPVLINSCDVVPPLCNSDHTNREQLEAIFSAQQ